MRIAVIGTGNMGQALVRGFISKGAHAPSEITLYDDDMAKASELAEATGCTFCSEMRDAVEAAETLLLAVKPQVMATVITQINEFIHEGTLVISIAAGISTDFLRGAFIHKNLPIVRVMPNTPALLGYGASALSFAGTTAQQEGYCMSLFESCGIAIRVDESKMDAVTGVSGSGPAYGMIFIEAMADAGVKLGLTRDEAIRLSAMTLKGAAAMVLETGVHPAELKDRVCSPGGTTIAAVHVLEQGGFRGTVMDAVFAAAKRSKELSGR
ncbi:MAG: pyrroline-5-carboxylate reductase [Saccharofermentanales bacterium]